MDKTNSSFRIIEVERLVTYKLFIGGLVEEDDRKWDRSRGGRISSGMKKLNIGDNTGDGGKVVGETIGTYGGIRVGLTHSQMKKKYFLVKLENSPERPRDNLGKLEEKSSSTSELLQIVSIWVPLPKDVVGASTQRCGGSLYPKILKEPLPKDVVGASWKME
nr:hypothetical protein [Tanacetum cinerariifolium]